MPFLQSIGACADEVCLLGSEKTFIRSLFLRKGQSCNQNSRVGSMRRRPPFGKAFGGCRGRPDPNTSTISGRPKNLCIKPNKSRCYRAAGAAQTPNLGDVADDFADDFADNFADDFDDDFVDDFVYNFQDDFLWLQNRDTCRVFGRWKIVLKIVGEIVGVSGGVFLKIVLGVCRPRSKNRIGVCRPPL